MLQLQLNSQMILLKTSIRGNMVVRATFKECKVATSGKKKVLFRLRIFNNEN